MAHPLCGADPATLAGAIMAGGLPDRWGRAAGIAGSVLARAPVSALEALLIARRLPPVHAMPPPVFILGHWRSGTTHLYNLLSLGGFGYVPPLATGLPWDMFGLARLLRPALERQLPPTRYIDNIPVTPTSPQEDEIALANMTPLSFYHGIYFPRTFDALIDRGVFHDGLSAARIARWERRMTYLMRKLALDQGARLMIKNPVYTARPAQLARMFPGAKFIHIHRNPFDVFLSMRNFYAKLLRELALQDVPDGLDIDATILRVYGRMMRAYDSQTAGWGPSDLIELPYARLDADPMGVLEEIHGALDLPGWAGAAPRYRAYLDSVRSYEKNAFAGDRAAVETVRAACAPWIERWGYAVPEPRA